MLTAILVCLASQQDPAGWARPETSKAPDAVSLSSPAQVVLGGLLGDRYAANKTNRLLRVDEDELLAGFRNRPGKQAWIGEHVGKWLHAAALTSMGRHDPALRAKMDRIVRGLLATQGPDGYLGTYEPGLRFGMVPGHDWDVWVHKYDMIGLLAYGQATRDPSALSGARKVADLLMTTFGPGGKRLSEAGQHQGMAATSVLEPVVLLYRATGDARYLQFAKRIVESYDEPNGPHILRDLLASRSVAKTANGKAYEMLSNLSGLVELYRVTGDRRYIQPVEIAWDDIVARRLYITGTGSAFEHWTQDGFMPNGEGDNVGENCVTVSWIQLNAHLYRLTGGAKYLDQIETSVYNHLLGSQRADGSAWCYYLPLEGRRQPTSDTNCCLSSGPRAIALLPTLAYAARKDGIDVNLYGATAYSGALHLRQSGGYPHEADLLVTVEKGSREPLTLRFRVPNWAANAVVNVDGKRLSGVRPGSFIGVKRVWRTGDVVRLRFPMPPRVVMGAGNNEGRRAFLAGPLVLATEAPGRPLVGDGVPRRLANGSFEVDGQDETGKSVRIPLLPFYQAGAAGKTYAVWLPQRPR